MSELKNSGEPAFPVVANDKSRLFESYGMTLHDYYVGQVIVGLTMSQPPKNYTECEINSKIASNQADAMIAEKEKRHKTTD